MYIRLLLPVRGSGEIQAKFTVPRTHVSPAFVGCLIARECVLGPAVHDAKLLSIGTRRHRDGEFSVRRQHTVECGPSWVLRVNVEYGDCVRTSIDGECLTVRNYDSATAVQWIGLPSAAAQRDWKVQSSHDFHTLWGH